jgi:hypothetical protein
VTQQVATSSNNEYLDSSGQALSVSRWSFLPDESHTLPVTGSKVAEGGRLQAYLRPLKVGVPEGSGP